jgi:inosine-uridine nucleoside N-ribohydrolase
MKKALIVLMLFTGVHCVAQKQAPIPIIFDTDIAPDYDDVGAMALLHAFADKGEATILATISSNAFETTVPTLSLLNTYFNRPGIPIGVVKLDSPNRYCSQYWAQGIIAKYPPALHSNNDAMDAVKLYRKILSVQPNKSVTVISVGFFTNLAGLLNSAADEYSNLSGLDLVKQKVKQLVSMAARIDKDGIGGYEFNVMVDAAASKKVFADWPTPITISGFEIGEKILTGIRLIHNKNIQNSPVKDAFEIALDKDSNTVGRNSWDQTAVLVAVRGLAPWFSFRKVNFDVDADGKNRLIPGKKITYLIFRQKPEAIARVIEDLMMHQPVKKLKP